jgi:hypothetical protein
MAGISVYMALVVSLAPQAGPRIHSVSDISHEFTFYMDGRFWSQYIGEADGADARNWGTLWKLDLDNVNLLVLSSGPGPVPYAPESIAHVRRFVEAGGAAVIMADHPRGEPRYPFHIQALANAFGAAFLPDPAEKPLKAAVSLRAETVEYYGGGILHLQGEWMPLVTDHRGRPVMARRPHGKGFVLVASRGLFGHQPDAKDPVNKEWIKPLLKDLVRNKPVDPARPPKGQFAELSHRVDGLTVEYNEGTRVFADAIVQEYRLVKKHLEQITGVPPSKGTLTNLLMLPTGGGGFSSGNRIGIGAWWGDYPRNRYPMIELISHEAGHSWVLPYGEPVWNEPIATYLGIEVGKRLGMKEAQETLDRAIARARKLDPDMNKVDISRKDAPNDVVWGKSYWIFEQLRGKFGQDAMAKYFQTKRRILQPGRKGYSLDDCVAVWSSAVGEDLFPWFSSLGISVDRSRTDLPVPAR